ncbi:MAG: CCA tRNA nucleotidyltransferase [Pirellulaceae bacterium]
MASIDTARARAFATNIVRRLRAAGFETLWAGGCVRDYLLGRTPKDYDVATSAKPDQIRALFGKRRTLPLGAAFGVITVLGPPQAGQIDVATFRCDACYSDGRHPDHVTFSTPEEDARRRDFTINGLFFDPLTETVVDYVGGREDLERQIIRAIGDPQQRIGEDKLRMLRAVRFATTYHFNIEETTFAAISERAEEVRVVSGERVAQELRRMLYHPNCHSAVELLRQTNLLAALLPELGAPTNNDAWQTTVAILKIVEPPSFAVPVAVLLRDIGLPPETGKKCVRTICRRWRLTNDERDRILRCLERETVLRTACRVPWPRLQRVLVGPGIEESLIHAEAVARVVNGDVSGIEYCRQKRALPADQWNPDPLISGNDLKEMGIAPGPGYRQILDHVRDAQLLHAIKCREDALRLAEEAYRKMNS